MAADLAAPGAGGRHQSPGEASAPAWTPGRPGRRQDQGCGAFRRSWTIVCLAFVHVSVLSLDGNAGGRLARTRGVAV